jgi:hypothetical protein
MRRHPTHPAAKSPATSALLHHTRQQRTKQLPMRHLCWPNTKGSITAVECALRLGCFTIISRRNATPVLCAERRESFRCSVLIIRHSSTQHLQLHLLQAHWDDVPEQLPSAIYRLAYDACVSSTKAFTKQTALKYRSVVEDLPAATAAEGYVRAEGGDA